MADAWKLVVRFGIRDGCSVPSVRDAAREVSLRFVTGSRRLDFGIGDTLDALAAHDIFPSEIGVDLLIVAAAIYCADTRISRSAHSQNNWTREAEFNIPVSDVDRWIAVTPVLESAVQFLTGDRWRFSFRRRPDGFEQLIRSRARRRVLLDNISLLSGGLDSFIGAIDLLSQGADPLLVSHSWAGIASKHQTLCIRALRRNFTRASVRHIRSRIGFPNDFIQGGGAENSERSRSFLFFSLAACAASASSASKSITLPENGLITLSVPLDPLRIGALSTRTTHPFFVARYNELLAQLGIRATMVNPYRHKTKGEMVRECVHQECLTKNLATTISCSSPTKGRWLGQSPGHCGYCVPCIIRRASLRGLRPPDPTTYALVDLRARPLASQKAEGEHVRSFQLAIRRLGGSPARAAVLIHAPGPLTDVRDEIDLFAKVYFRGMAEVQRLLDGVTTRPYV
ncbi:MAG TPA: Qat anti-phage system QueC-like protein QatC [Candidatus Udaeobacter sp.]|jgi:hypothetical protein